jgi:hypothetical protein
MKKTLKTAGALGLAAATVLTGLSFGPAAASAAPAPSIDSTSAGERVPFRLVFQTVTGSYAGIGNAGGGNDILTKQVSTLTEAVAGAVTYEYDRSNRHVYLSSGKCWYFDAGVNGISETGCNASDSRQLWTPLADGGFAVDAAPERRINGTVRDGSYLRNERTHMGTDNFATILEGYRPFEASVSSVDVSNRTATLLGKAEPRAAVIINGADQVIAEEDGSWSATVSGLTLGLNTISLEQWENGAKTADATVDVDLVVSPLVATTSFPSDHARNAVASGTAHPGATIIVKDAAGTQIADTIASTNANGAWSVDIPAPGTGGGYPVTIHQEIDGEANGEISETVAYGNAVAIDMPADDMAHDGGPVAMRGTGEPGAQVAVREQGHATVLGTATVLASGNWNLSTTTVDNRKHVLEVTQTGKGNNVTTSTVTLNPEAGAVAPVTVETPENGSTVTTSRPTFTGHGQDGATVTIGYGANSIIGTAVVENGEWTINPTRGLGMGTSNLVVTQTAGAETQTVNHTLNRVVAEQPLAVTSHVDGQTYAEGVTTFRGTAPVGSAIRATNQWGTVMGTATATDGSWSFNRNLGPTTAGYDLAFVATPPVGAPQTVSLKLNYAGVTAFQITSPVNNSTYSVGTTTFTGTAAPGTAVAATNQWGTSMGRASTALGTTWAFDRYLGPTSAGYDITFVATKGTDVQRSTLHLATAVVNVPVAVTSIADGATYRPGLNVLTGTGTPGATVEAVNATNGWNVPMGKATVKADGTWTLPERNWGPSNDYAIQVTQTNPDKTTSTTTVNVKAPVFAPLVLTSPQVGDTYDTGVAARFEGTATPFAEITVRSAQSSSVYRTVEADADGNWSFTRVWGPTHDYVLNIDQKATNGQADSITGFAWNHSGN